MNKPAAHSHPFASAFFCVSLNPAIDTRLILNGFLPGRVNRVAEVNRAPGGKAAHVAMALKGLGATPTWIGFSGGATGKELLAGLRLLEIETMAISTGQSSRVNLEILDTQGEVTEILEPGGTITQSEWSEFQQVCAGAFQLVADKKIAVISGSLPPGVPTEACAVLVSFPYLTPSRRHKPLASYWSWARTPPSSASASAALSAFESTIGWQFTPGPLRCAQNLPSAAVMRLL